MSKMSLVGDILIERYNKMVTKNVYGEIREDLRGQIIFGKKGYNFLEENGTGRYIYYDLKRKVEKFNEKRPIKDYDYQNNLGEFLLDYVGKVLCDIFLNVPVTNTVSKIIVKNIMIMREYLLKVQDFKNLRYLNEIYQNR